MSASGASGRARVASALAGLLAALWDRVVPVRRAVAVQNLLATGIARDPEDARRRARAVARHLARVVLELPGLWLGGPRGLERRLRIEGFERLGPALAARRGVVLVSAHLGNWEALAASARVARVPLVMVVRPPRGALSRLGIAAVRRRLGARAVPEGDALSAARAALRSGAAVGLVIDQRPPARHAVPGTFLGLPAAISKAPAVLALGTGAPVFTALAHRAPDGIHVVSVDGPFSPPEGGAGTVADRVAGLTRVLSARVEAAVREHPDQWLWMHRRWKGGAG